jgi:peptide deformylase
VSEIEGEVREEELDPQAEARRRLALAQIRQFPDPVLKLHAREVEAFDDELRALVERMKSLMADASGIGLAGNQVGVLRRVFVFQPGADDDIVAVVNPQIGDRSEEVAEDEEGCLSLQGIRVPVERSVRVSLAGKDIEGGELRLELEGIGARVAQHELDHLDGVLILDRTTPEARREAMAVLRPKPLLVTRP